IKLNHYSYPGNVRELENIVLNAVAKTKDQTLITQIDIPDLANSVLDNLGVVENKFNSIDAVVKDYIKVVMKHTMGNVQKAAFILGISERTLQRRLQKVKK
ncbi:MAG: sigma-54-dependent Fis family transcriptional regulator, partial [Bacteroidetes bacterium]|nr:sigma-54-dependent Fis family transcriptional regulator [Bacteroidota bacterium]